MLKKKSREEILLECLERANHTDKEGKTTLDTHSSIRK